MTILVASPFFEASRNFISIRIYDSPDQNSCRLIDFPIRVTSHTNPIPHLDLILLDRCTAALTRGSQSHSLPPSRPLEPRYSNCGPFTSADISPLARNGTFIAASANSSVSFWNTSTHDEIGLVCRLACRYLPVHKYFSQRQIRRAAGLAERAFFKMLPQSYLVHLLAGILVAVYEDH